MGILGQLSISGFTSYSFPYDHIKLCNRAIFLLFQERLKKKMKIDENEGEDKEAELEEEGGK